MIEIILEFYYFLFQDSLFGLMVLVLSLEAIDVEFLAVTRFLGGNSIFDHAHLLLVLLRTSLITFALFLRRGLLFDAMFGVVSF